MKSCGQRSSGESAFHTEDDTPKYEDLPNFMSVSFFRLNLWIKHGGLTKLKMFVIVAFALSLSLVTEAQPNPKITKS